MPRSISIQNISASDIQLSDGVKTHTVPAFGYASFPYSMYAQIALSNDLRSYPIRVHIPNEQIARASVDGYGAMGDGVTDDTVAIQRAIDDMESYGGGSVSLPVGIYVISSISISGAVSLIGESSDSTIIKSSGESPSIVIDGADCSIFNISIISSGNQTVIGISDGHAEISDCVLQGAKCLYLESGSTAMLSGCKLASSGTFYDIANYLTESDSSTLSEEFCVYERI